MIQKATKQEREALIPIYKEAFQIHSQFQKSKEEIKNYMQSLDAGWVVAKEEVQKKEGNIVGGLCIGKKGEIWRIKHLAIQKTKQKQGFGKELMQFAEKNIVKKGVIEIHVSENEKDALAFYQSLGYKIKEEKENHYRNGEKAYFLRKKI